MNSLAQSWFASSQLLHTAADYERMTGAHTPTRSVHALNQVTPAIPTVTDPALKTPGMTDSYQLSGAAPSPKALSARVASHRLLGVAASATNNEQNARSASSNSQCLDDWHRSIRRGALWTRALWTTLSVLRNSSTSVACAWFLAFLCSIGTLSTAPAEEQSYTRFFTATVLWGHTFFCAAVFTTQVFFLVSHQLVETHSASSVALKPSLDTWVSVRGLFRRTYVAYFMSLSLLLATCYSVGKLLPVGDRKYKLEFYLGCVASHIYTVKSMIATRQLIQEQSARLQQQQQQQSGTQPNEGASVQSRQRGFAKQMAHFWILVLQNWSLAFTVILAGLFVQGISQYHIASQLEMLLLAGGSVLFKLLVQESIKVRVFRRNIQDLRTMCVVIGLPTVLIDTQLRIALQRVQSFGVTLNGTILMAGAEICMRMLKMLLLKLEIRREMRKLHRQALSKTNSTQSVRSQRSQRLQEQSKNREEQLPEIRFQSSQTRTRRASIQTLKFQRWKNKLLLFHTAEIYADISAEYIAIGCSTAILYFFWNHPKFLLSQFDPIASENSPSSSSQGPAGEVARWSRYTSVGISIGAEIVVDYLSTVFELRAGIDFDELRKIGRFITCFFLCATAINIQISVIFYMQVEQLLVHGCSVEKHGNAVQHLFATNSIETTCTASLFEDRERQTATTSPVGLPEKPPDPMESVSPSVTPAPGPRQLKRFVKLNAIQPLSVISAFISDTDPELIWSAPTLSSDPGFEQVHSVRAASELVPTQTHSAVLASRLPSSQQAKTTLKRRLRGEMWLQALQTLSILLGNTAFCVAWAWFANFGFSRGNIFFGTPVSKQSDFEFLAGTLMLLHINFYGIIAVVHVPVLWQWQFVSLRGGPRATNPAKFVHICSKLVRYTWTVFMVSCLLNLATVFALRGAPARTKAFKIEFYVSCLWIHLYISAISVAVRRIYLLETIEGQLKMSSHQAANQGNRAFTTRFFWKMYFYTFPKICVVWLAGVFVQVMSQSKIKSLEDFVWFTSGSLILKLVAKKIAKFAVVSFDVKDLRSVFVVAGIPTVIIDTQIRIVVQKEQSTKYTLRWTSAMAIYEIMTRVAKVLLTARQIRLKQVRVVVDPIVAAAGVQVLPGSKTNAKSPDPPVPRLAQTGESQTITVDGFEKWRRQIRAFQIAESYANMSAEYIAIGCSTSILYFYWDHPKFQLGGKAIGVTGDQSGSIFPWSHSTALGVQILVEIVVDYFSCVLEISGGVDFQQVRRYRVFLALLFISFAAMNVQICSVIYMKTE